MKTVAVFFGGQSAEHDVSIITALTSVIKPLELTKKYQVVPVYIAKNGAWYSFEGLKKINFYQSKDIEAKLSQKKPIGVKVGNGLKMLVVSRVHGTKEIKVDIAFPALHGTHGEDGELMGMFEMAGLPYVGCDVAASAIAMDKVFSKQIAAAAGVPITKSTWCSKVTFETNEAAVLEDCKKLEYPLFVKPAHLGSSIGISQVHNERELTNALELAAHYDNKIIVEEAVHNLVEVTLPIMGNDTPTPALLERPITQAEDFFDFETKYLHGGKKAGKNGGLGKGAAGAQGYSEIPAQLPAELYDTAVETGLKVYKALGCSGIARIDMLIDTKTKTVYFNEANPLPGSLYAHNWAKAGVSKVQLVEKLIEYAEARAKTKRSLKTTFKTSFLTQF
ncbi:MAG: D-alanine--D-alanine ligase family protein [Candidatus Saccharimonadales bacterium]